VNNAGYKKLNKGGMMPRAGAGLFSVRLHTKNVPREEGIFLLDVEKNPGTR